MASVSERVGMIEYLDQVIVSTIQDACRHTLGVYQVDAIKRTPDRILKRLASMPHTTAAVMAFKRGCRAAAPALSASNPDIPLHEEVKLHFQQVFAPPSIASPDQAAYFPAHSAYFDSRHKLSADTLDMFGVGDYNLSHIMTAEAVERFLNRYNPTKACGMDSIHTLILRPLVAYSLLRFHLAYLFSMCALTGITPTRWNESLIYPLGKKADAKHITECRPIALTPMFRRAFESILLDYVHTNPACEQIRKFHPTQAGFRRGHSTMLHAAMSHDLSFSKPKPNRVFIDFKQAYDRVPIQLLVGKLAQRECPPAIVSLLISLFTRGGIRVAVNGDTTDRIPIFRGVFQGSLMSPFLFLVFIDDLAKQLSLSSTPAYPRCLLFADDLEIIEHNNTILQSLCDLTTEWAHANGMAVGLSKCGYLGRPPDTPLLLDGEEIPSVEEYQYLGFPHTRRGIDVSKYIDAIIAKARRLLNWCMHRGKGWPYWIRMCIYRAFIRPILDYGGQLWPHVPHLLEPKMASLEAFQHEAFKWIIPSAPHPAAAGAILAFPPLRSRFLGMSATFLDHVQAMRRDHPIRAFVDTLPHPIQWDRNLLTPRLSRSNLRNRLNREAETEALEYHTVLRRWYCQEAVNRHKAGCYITSASRCKAYGPDKVIFWPSPLVDIAMAWRVGSFGFRSQCPRGGHRFNRACISRCDIIPQHPLRRDATPRHAPTHYSIVDHWLNQGRQAQFGSIIEAVAVRIADNITLNRLHPAPDNITALFPHRL
jgi:hypothetical protein